MAIMVTPKLANLPDVTTTTPSDGQVLTYDTASGKWINEDAASGGVTDHGALTGLADDDHTQYIPVTAARAFTGSPSAPGVGTNSERFGSGATAGGNESIAIGKSANAANIRSMAIGYTASATADGAVAVGRAAVVTGVNSILVGANGTLAASNSIVIGVSASAGAENSVILGRSANGASGLNRNVLLGANTNSGAYSDTVAIGNLATNTSSNQMMIGNHAYPLNIVQKTRIAGTNSINSAITIDQTSQSTPTTGFGAGILFQLESSTTDSQDAARISAVWSDATHATRTADIVFSTVSGAAALSEKLRLTGAGILKFSGTMGDSTKTVGTDAPADWIEVQIGSDTRYIPVYAAS